MQLTASLTTGSANGWSVIDQLGRYAWNAFVLGASRSGVAETKAEAEREARAALSILKGAS
jgi:hypothetical protein